MPSLLAFPQGVNVGIAHLTLAESCVMEKLYQADCTPDHRKELGGGGRARAIRRRLERNPQLPMPVLTGSVTSMGTAAVFLSPAPGGRRQRLRFCLEVGKAREEC